MIDNENNYNGQNTNGQRPEQGDYSASGLQNTQNGSSEQYRQSEQSSAYVVNEPNASGYNGQGGNPNGYNSAPQNGRYGGTYSENVNSMSYDPAAENKHKKSRKVLTAVIAVLCVAAIALTGVVGINFISSGIIGDSSGSSSSGTTLAGSDSTDDDSSESTRDTSNLPTIYQLSAGEDSLTIPEIVEKCKDSVVAISCTFSTGTGLGTGIVMSGDGYIITNAHVVEDATDISVAFTDESDEGYQAELIGIDTQTDLAVVKIDKTGLTAAEFGKSSELQVGEAAIAVGNPLSLELAGSVTAGIISAVDRELTVDDKTLTLIQTDASINNGNSGGALLNSYGQVIGITSAKINSTYGEGLGFAIPIDEAVPIVQDLIENGYVTGRPSLGLSGTDVSEFYSEYYGIPQGFYVQAVTSGSAAENAGIQVGDIIVGIEGTLIANMSEFNDIKNQYSAGDTVTISLYRDGERMDVEVTLDEQKNEETDEEATTESQGYSWGGYSFR